MARFFSTLLFFIPWDFAIDAVGRAQHAMIFRLERILSRWEFQKMFRLYLPLLFTLLALAVGGGGGGAE